MSRLTGTSTEAARAFPGTTAHIQYIHYIHCIQYIDYIDHSILHTRIDVSSLCAEATRELPDLGETDTLH